MLKKIGFYLVCFILPIVAYSCLFLMFTFITWQNVETLFLHGFNLFMIRVMVIMGMCFCLSEFISEHEK